jgi:hypothetical protein
MDQTNNDNNNTAFILNNHLINELNKIDQIKGRVSVLLKLILI